MTQNETVIKLESVSRRYHQGRLPRGQQQRVVVARAIVAERDLVLAEGLTANGEHGIFSLYLPAAGGGDASLADARECPTGGGPTARDLGMYRLEVPVDALGSSWQADPRGLLHRARAPSRWRLLRPPRRPVSLCVGRGRGGKLRIRRRISTTVNGFQMCPERAEKHALRASETERSMFLDRPKGWELP